jgi:hypothetical protein
MTLGSAPFLRGVVNLLIPSCYSEAVTMFEAGRSGNPRGRPRGSYDGRIQALAGLDRLLARKKNQKALIRAL